MAPWEYNVRKENLVQIRSAGTRRLSLFNLYTCAWLNLKDFRSDSKLIFSFQLIKISDLGKKKSLTEVLHRSNLTRFST